LCGRYSLLTEDEIIEVREMLKKMSVNIAKDEFEQVDGGKKEVCPTDRSPVITMDKASGGIGFENLKWGFKKWQGSGVIINARSETLKTVGMFSRLLNVGRCVVPAGEYYEWGKAPKKKHIVKDKEGNLLYMAGLYRDTDDGREFVIITKNALGEVTKIHDRMPVVLLASQIEDWLNGGLSPEMITALDFNAVVVCAEI